MKIFIDLLLPCSNAKINSRDTYSDFINTINGDLLLIPTGGLTIAQIEEENKKNSMFTCPNRACGKAFTKPLKALNLQRSSERPYDACPYCLTEIAVNDEPAITNDENEKLEQETFEPENFEQTEVPVEESVPAKEKSEVAESTSGCAHYLGYLSEKASSDQIPDECITCKDIVTCMLKKMNT